MADAGTKASDQALEQDVEVIDDFESIVDECPEGKCCPPSTGKMVIMGVGSAVVFLVLFFLMVRLLERVFIRQERSPLLGRHLGISVALFLGALGMSGIFFIVAGCWYGPFTYWAIFAGVVWLLHLLYTLFAVRKD